MLLVTGVLALHTQLQAQDRLRLSIRGSDGQIRRAVGWLADMDDDSVVVVNGGYRMAFARGSVALVERSQGIRTSGAARTGALVAGGYALVLGLAMTGRCDPGAFIQLACGASMGDVIKVTMFAAVTGASLGAIIATLSGERWQMERLDQIRLRGSVTPSGGGVSMTVRF